MSTATLLPLPRATFFDANGAPLAGGFVYTYVPGGTTPQLTWQDAGETTPNANPIVLDADGSCLLYGSGSYQITVTDSLGNQVPTYSGLTSDVVSSAGVSAAMQPVVGASTLAIAIAALFAGNPVEPMLTASSLTAAIEALFAGNETSGQTVYGGIFPGVTFEDNVVGYNINSVGSSLDQVTAIAGYARSIAATIGGNNNSVALFGCGTAEVDSAAVWGVNTLLQDSATRVVGTGSGRILLNEFDFNVMNPNTQVIGCSVGGNSLAQPATSSGFIVNSLGSGIKWSGGFITEDGAAVTAVSIATSAATPGPNFASQFFDLSYYDNTSTKQVIQINAQSVPGNGGNLVIGGSATTAVTLPGGNMNLSSGVYTSGGNQVVGPRINGWGTSSGGTRGPITSPSTIGLPALASIVSQLLSDLENHGLLGV